MIQSAKISTSIVGIRPEEKQHEMLFALLKALEDAFELKLARSSISNIADQLVGSATAIFATEDMLMRLYDFPEADKHQREHVHLLDGMAQFAHDFAEGWFVDSDEFLRKLRAQLSGHASRNDNRMKKYLQGCGVV